MISDYITFDVAALLSSILVIVTLVVFCVTDASEMHDRAKPE